MMKSLFAITALTGSMLLAPAAGFAADQHKDQPRDQGGIQMQDQIYSSQFLTEQEQKLTRYELHKQMKIRAQEKGLALEEEPLMQGKGMSPSGGTSRF